MTDFTDPKHVWERRGEVGIVDVRELWEFADRAIEGAVHVPLGDLVTGGAAPIDPAKPVVVVCSNGERSELAALMLQVRGLDAHSLSGGFEAWEREGLPLTPAGTPRETIQAN